jgi:hypothetical protein
MDPDSDADRDQDADLDPPIFVTDLQDANKEFIFKQIFCLLGTYYR